MAGFQGRGDPRDYKKWLRCLKGDQHEVPKKILRVRLKTVPQQPPGCLP